MDGVRHGRPQQNAVEIAIFSVTNGERVGRCRVEVFGAKLGLKPAFRPGGNKFFAVPFAQLSSLADAKHTADDWGLGTTWQTIKNNTAFIVAILALARKRTDAF